MAAEAHRAGHPARVLVGAEGRHARRQHAEHRLAQAQLDGRGGAPDHAYRGAAAQIDHFGEVELHAQVFGGHRRHEHRGLVELRAVDHQAVEVLGAQAGIGQGARGQIGHLLQMEHARRGRVLLRFVLGRPNDGGVAFESHGFLHWRRALDEP
ncbi:hypothetical protein D3C84_930850 [compost metagenome]